MTCHPAVKLPFDSYTDDRVVIDEKKLPAKVLEQLWN
jgi:hypothetical protein